MTTQTKTTWRKVKLGEVCSSVSESFDFKKNNKFIFINTGDIENGKFLHKNYFKGFRLPGQAKKAIRKNDILYSEIRPKNKHFAFVDFHSDELVVSTKLMVIRNNEKIDPIFLYLYLTNKNTLNAFQTIAESRSGTFPQLTFESIASYPILLPSLQEQKLISLAISAFDDKIEVNNKISRTLEQMAQAIFKEWFANNEKLKVKSEKLKGWEVKNIMEIIKRLPVGKRYDNRTALPKGKIPILDQGQSGIIGFHNEKPSIKASPQNPVAVFSNHTCYYRLVTFNFSCIQNVIPYIGTNGYPTLFVYYLTRNKIKMSDYKGHWPEFAAQKFIVPPQPLAVRFSQKLQPFIENISKNEKENQTLASLRDLLLPKLMSGEARV